MDIDLSHTLRKEIIIEYFCVMYMLWKSKTNEHMDFVTVAQHEDNWYVNEIALYGSVLICLFDPVLTHSAFPG